MVNFEVMDKYTKLNIIIGISFLICSMIFIILSPNFDGLFISTTMALLAFLNLRIAQAKLKKSD